MGSRGVGKQAESHQKLTKGTNSMQPTRWAGTFAAVAGLSTLLCLPAAAATSHGTTVAMTQGAGTRQFFVEDLAGRDLTSLDFGRGGTAGLRVRVADSDYSAVTENFSVSATLNNLYLVSGQSHAFGTKIPSSAVSVGFGSSPLNATGLSVNDLPTYALSGTVPSCATLQTLSPGVLGSITTDPNAVPLCALLGAGGTAVSSVSVQGLAQTVQLTVSNLADLPVQLATGGNTGPFTNADYTPGTIGAADSAAAGAPSATGRNLMTGTAAFSAGLITQLTTKLAAAVASLPVTTPTDAGARATVNSVVSALQVSGTSAIAQLGGDIAALGSAAMESAIINQLTATVGAPVQGDLLGLTGSYVSFPMLTASASAPAPGSYEGTLTVTLVQG